MAEELDKKPNFVLNKKQPSTAATPDKSEAKPVENAVPKKKVVVGKKKNPSSNQPAVAVRSGKPHIADKNGTTEKRKPVSSIELSPPRPNIKVGNLADKPKRQPEGRKEGGAAPGGNRGGFTGAQAREGYHSRNAQSAGASGRGGFGGKPDGDRPRSFGGGFQQGGTRGGLRSRPGG